MNKAIYKFFVILVLTSSSAWSATKVLMPSERLPRELIYLTESIQELQLKDIEKTRDNDKLFKNLEDKFQSLSKEELYFISKSEIYKTALAFKPPLNITDKYFQKSIITEVEEKIKTVKLNSFTHWLIASILKDLNDIFNNRDFPTFFAERNKGIVISSKSKRLQKKLNFLLPWIQGFLTEETALFQYSLLPLMNKSLQNISIKIDYLLRHSAAISPNSKSQEKIVYFEEQSMELDKSGKLVTVEDILDPLIGKLKNNNLPVPVDDWIGDEDDFASGLTPIEINKAEGNYQAPKKLPAPVEGW
ncbi:MAG: hypothetical protein CME70_21900 [Halobacteriovorax sp.]|nr:hypothetical protein [Halobacteriovorax sp.]|tara:strand:+ start:57569 stop:58477 length:909 start_codon:yes stop_codon:yes gene_type:complete